MSQCKWDESYIWGSNWKNKYHLCVASFIPRQHHSFKVEPCQSNKVINDGKSHGSCNSNFQLFPLLSRQKYSLTSCENIYVQYYVNQMLGWFGFGNQCQILKWTFQLYNIFQFKSCNATFVNSDSSVFAMLQSLPIVLQILEFF